MFGLIVSGRLVQSDPTPVDATHVVFDVLDPDSVKHVVVFMTGQTPFPDGYAGAVYFMQPSGFGIEPLCLYLGYLSNDKPSAIFKILKNNTEPNTMQNSLFQNSLGSLKHGQIGISVEPISNIQNMVPVQGATLEQQSSFVDFATKMLENFSNFATSFAKSYTQLNPSLNESYVPASVVNNWYTNFLRKIELDAYFWKK